jgi:hypothetical protein
MAEIENKILTVIEPAIELDEMSIPDVESGTQNSEGLNSQIPPSKTSSVIALIRINEYEVQQDRINLIKLRNTGFYPTIKIIFDDRDAMFMARYFPKDGDIIQVFIRSQGDETTFKPIRIDFTIVDISPVGGGGNVSANKFMVEGRMFVPDLFTEKVQIHNGTSWNSLLTIAEELQLGYASNVDDTADEMTWINPNDTVEKYIQDIVSNSYLDDEHFFTAYIDPYYYLTLVDVNSLFSQEGALEASKTFSQNAGDLFSKSVGEEDNFPNFLSNLVQMQGGARYISKYQMVNESGAVSKNNGYKRYSQSWNLIDREFINEFVDPITNNTPGFIPGTKGRIIDGEPEGPRENQLRFKYLGTQSENVHDEYMYSVILNYQNLIEITKMGMVIELDTVNPALLRYTRIYCYILEYGTPQKTVLTQGEYGSETPPEGGAERSTTAEQDSEAKGILNEYLSGFYVISGIEYIQTAPGGLRMKLYLQRREFKPTT